jgi:hypothetical protein
VIRQLASTSLCLSILSFLREKRVAFSFYLYFSIPLYAESEEMVIQRSAVRVGNRRFA